MRSAGGGNEINCWGCGNKFITKTKTWDRHYKECHKPASERLNIERELEQEAEKYRERLEQLTSTGLSRSQAAAIMRGEYNAL